jgi:hypothetical protein
MVGWGGAGAGTWAGGDGCLFEGGRFLSKTAPPWNWAPATTATLFKKGSGHQLRHFGRAV